MKPVLTLTVPLIALFALTAAADEHRERGDRERHHKEMDRDRHPEEMDRERPPEERFEREMGHDDVVHFLQKKAPEVWEHARRMHRESEEAFDDFMEEAHEHVEEYMEIARENMEEADRWLRSVRLEFQIDRMAEKYAEAYNEEEKGELKRRIRKLLEQSFDLQLAEGEQEVQALERELEEVRALMERRRKARDRIVNRRFEEIVDEAEGLDWW